MVGLPPATALTVHETVVSAEPVTVAVKVCVLPKRSEVAAGVIVTVMDEGVGGGGGDVATDDLVPPVLPAQPSVRAAAKRRMKSGSAAMRGCPAL